jgi:hypothetical protein
MKPNKAETQTKYFKPKFKTMRNFKLIESDIDYSIYKRVFSGKITKKRYLKINKYCRKKSFRATNCGCSYDCCGCLSSQKLTFEYKQNQIIVILNHSFNY